MVVVDVTTRRVFHIPVKVQHRLLLPSLSAHVEHAAVLAPCNAVTGNRVVADEEVVLGVGVIKADVIQLVAPNKVRPQLASDLDDFCSTLGQGKIPLTC